MLATLHSRYDLSTYSMENLTIRYVKRRLRELPNVYNYVCIQDLGITSSSYLFVGQHINYLSKKNVCNDIFQIIEIRSRLPICFSRTQRLQVFYIQSKFVYTPMVVASTSARYRVVVVKRLSPSTRHTTIQVSKECSQISKPSHILVSTGSFSD